MKKKNARNEIITPFIYIYQKLKIKLFSIFFIKQMLYQALLNSPSDGFILCCPGTSELDSISVSIIINTYL